MKEMTPKEAAKQINVMRGDFLTTIGSWTGVKEIPMSEKDYNALKVAVNVCEEYDDLKAKIYAQSTTMLSMEKDISELREKNKQLKNCKHYVKMKRAVAYEVGDQHFKLSKQEYPWYEENVFPDNMEKLVKEDNPFGGWYKYEIEEKYAQAITIKAEDYSVFNSSELQTGDLVKDEYGHTGIFISNSDFREDTGYFLVKQGKFFNTLESMKRNWSKVKHFSGFSEVIDSLNN